MDCKPNVVFVLGGPGAGKGTQCEKIVQRFHYVHLSAGELLRQERSKTESKYRLIIEDHIQSGSIVPVEITCSLLQLAIEEDGGNKFLIDGFPRNQDNEDGWKRIMADRVNLQFVLFFECADETCIQRCLGRGAAGSGRTDDNVESLKKRIVTYKTETMPIVEHYRTQNLLVTVDASRNPDQVFVDVAKLFSEAATGKGQPETH